MEIQNPKRILNPADVAKAYDACHATVASKDFHSLKQSKCHKCPLHNEADRTYVQSCGGVCWHDYSKDTRNLTGSERRKIIIRRVVEDRCDPLYVDLLKAKELSDG